MIFSSHICSIALLQIVNEQILRFTWLLHVIKRLFASRIKSLGPMVNWRVLLHLLCEFFMVRHLPIISVFQSMEFSEEVADEFMVRKDSLRCFRFLDYLKFKFKANIPIEWSREIELSMKNRKRVETSILPRRTCFKTFNFLVFASSSNLFIQRSPLFHFLFKSNNQYLKNFFSSDLLKQIFR